MNSFGLWLHQLFNPHCPHCIALEREKADRTEESKVCVTCEALKMELSLAHIQINTLQSALINPVKTEEPKTDTSGLKPILPTRVPWKVRQQMLEREDRHAAELIRKNNESKSSNNPDLISLEDLEKEMKIHSEAQENVNAISGSNAQVQERPAS